MAPPSRWNPLPQASSATRGVLFGFAGQLALLCAFMSMLEGVFGSSTELLERVAGSDSDDNDDLQRVVRALPVFVVLHVLLDKTRLDALWGLQLLVASKIHKSALFPIDTETSARVLHSSYHHSVATIAFALMLLTYPLVRFSRRMIAKPWVAAVLLVTLAESIVLAFADETVMPAKRVLLLNCGFLASSSFALAVLVGSSQPAATPSAQTGALAFGVVALLATFVRARVGLSERVFVASLVAQLLLTLLACKTLAAHMSDVDDDGEDNADDSECSSDNVFRFVALLVVFAIGAGVFIALALAAEGLRQLV